MLGFTGGWAGLREAREARELGWDECVGFVYGSLAVTGGLILPLGPGSRGVLAGQELREARELFCLLYIRNACVLIMIFYFFSIDSW